MHRILRFKPHLSVEPTRDGMIFLIGEHEHFLLQGRVYELVVPLVDGLRTTGEIMEMLEGKASLPEVYYALMMLEKNGYVVEAEHSISTEAAAFWHCLGVDAALASARLAATAISILTVNGEDLGPLVEAVTAAGIAIREDAPLRIVVTGDYLDRGLEALNRRALEERFRWMPIKPTGSTPWFGPMFRPGEGPCWECLAARLRANRPVETFVAQRLVREVIVSPRAMVPLSARAALDLGVMTIARWIVDGGRGEVDDQLLALDLRRMRVEEHAVRRRPQCPACGDPELLKKRAERPIVLEPRPKRFTEDGGYRCMTPAETYARYEHLVSPITGVVTSIGPVPERDHPLRPVYGAAYFVCPAPGSTPNLQELSRVSLGKGCTAVQSRTGALCEAIERSSSIFRGDEVRRRASFRELQDEAVHPQKLLNFSETQYARRDESNGKVVDYRRRIPLRYDERAAIDWTPAWSLTTGKRQYLPTAYCYLQAPAPPEEQFAYFDPNGHASGNCLEEAILQAFFELAERDAIGIWWYNRIPRPAVDLASFEQPYFLILEEHYRSMGYQIWVLDITTDLGVPAFVALGRAEASGRFCVGFGCHAEARLGVQRALTELSQIFDPMASSPAPWDTHEVQDPAYLFPSTGQLLRRRDDFSPSLRRDLREDVLGCVERAAALGLDTIVLDQTCPDVGLHAVKVVVPGLRHLWARLGPGRLYEVPARLGWLEAPKAESDLNPVHLFL